MLRLGCLLVFMLIGAAIALSTKYLPWWGTLLVILGSGIFLVVLLPRLISRGAIGMVKRMIEEKSRVLRDASVTVHEMAWVDPPLPPVVEESEVAEEDEWNDEEEEEAEDHFADIELLDSMPHLRMVVTIKPAAQSGEMSYYEPSDLTMVPFDKPTDLESMENQNDDSDSDEDDLTPNAPVLRLTELATDEGGWTDDFDKVLGEHKLRLLFAMPPKLGGRLKFQYYLEGIGDFILPAKQDNALPAE